MQVGPSDDDEMSLDSSNMGSNLNIWLEGLNILNTSPETRFAELKTTCIESILIIPMQSMTHPYKSMKSMMGSEITDPFNIKYRDSKNLAI